MKKPNVKNPFRKENYVKPWIVFFWLFAVNMIIFTLIAFLVEPIWNDINNFLGNALKLHWNWLLIILCISFLLIFYAIYLSLGNFKKYSSHKEDTQYQINVKNKIIPLIFFFIWNLMLYVLIDEGGEELRIIRPALETISPILYVAIIILLSGLIAPLLRFIQKLSFSKPSSNMIRSYGILVFLLSTNLIGFLLPILSPPVNILKGDLPPKPKIMAHRGAASLAPENTLSAGVLAAEWGAVGWEVDVSISYDGVLFLCHDDTFERTTDIKDVFPDRIKEDVTMFNISEIRRLDAGSWFIEADPFKTIADGYISSESAEGYRGEKVPNFAEVLNLTRDYDLFLDVDAGGPPEDHPYHDLYWDILILQLYESGLGKKILINSDNILTEIMTQVGEGRDLINTHHAIPNSEYRAYKEQRIPVMVWTVDSVNRFSQLWCLGVDYVKTNVLQILIPLNSPNWTLSYSNYVIIWISTSLVCIVAGLLVHFYQKNKISKNAGI